MKFLCLFLSFSSNIFGFYPAPLIETLNVSVDTLINNYENSIEEINLVKND